MKSIAAWLLSFTLAMGMCPVAYADFAAGPNPDREVHTADDGVLSEDDAVHEGVAEGAEESQGQEIPSDAFEEDALNPGQDDSDGSAGERPDSFLPDENAPAKEQGAAEESERLENAEGDEGVDGDRDSGAEDGQDGADEGQGGQSELDALAAANRFAVADGIYTIHSAIDSSAVVEVSGGSSADGAKIQLYSSNLTDAQRWQVSHDERGYVTFANVKSGKVLEVKGGATEPGAPVQLYHANETQSQKWIVVPEGETFKVVSALGIDLVLDAYSGLTQNGTAVQLYADNETNAQRWTFESYEDALTSLDSLARENEAVLPDGEYLIRSGLSFDKLIEISGGSLSEGVVAHLYTFNATIAQRWVVSHDEDGYVIFTNAKSGLALCAAGGQARPGTQTMQGAYDGSRSCKWIVTANADNSYEIASALYPKIVLEVKGGDSSNGAAIQLYGNNETAAQTWTFEDYSARLAALDDFALGNAPALADGEYLVRTELASAKVAEVAAGSLDTAANVQLYTSNMTAAQRWVVSHDEGGYVIFTNAKSGLVLASAGEQSKAGVNIVQEVPSGSRAQKWIAKQNENGSYLIVSALDSDVVMEVAGADTSDGANIQLYSSNGTTAQLWRFISTSPRVAPCEDILPEGWYAIASANDARYVLDIASGSVAEGANVQLYNANGSMAQMFRFEYCDGYYRIVNARSERALDVTGGNLVPTTNVQQCYPIEGNKNQLFSVAENEDGTYTFINAATGLAMESAGGAVGNGVNVHVYTPNGTPAQCFSLVEQTNFLREGVCSIGLSIRPASVLDVDSGSMDDGANVRLWSSNSSPAQKWDVALVEGRENVYRIQSLASGKYLTADAGGNVCQRSWSGDDSQCWSPSISRGSIVLANVATGLLLDAAGGESESGTNIQVYEENGTSSQRFDFTMTDPISNGTYFIKIASSPNQVLDVEDDSRANWANVQAYEVNDTGAQKWDVVKNSDGTYYIMNARSKKYLDVSGNLAADGQNVQQYELEGSLGQKWYITYDDGYRIASALDSSYVLEVADTSAHNGSNICIGLDEGASSQRFLFQSTTYTDSKVLDAYRSDILSWLEPKEYDDFYLGTRYSFGFSIPTCMYPNGMPRYDGYTGMNCTGFVAHVYQMCGGDVEAVGRQPQGGTGSYINAWKWYYYAVDYGAEMYEFNSVADMLASGVAEKGDIIFFKTTGGIDCHIGFFWGDTPHENKMWHQILGGNLISNAFNNANKSEWGQTTVLIKGF